VISLDHLKDGVEQRLVVRQNKFASAAEWETAAKNNVRKYTVRRFVGV
jgi:hypothetical protein